VMSLAIWFMVVLRNGILTQQNAILITLKGQNHAILPVRSY